MGILKEGFKPGNNPTKCRIGKGVYFTTRLECAVQIAKSINGTVLTAALHTKGKIVDTGDKNYNIAAWLWGKAGIALGWHPPWPAICNNHFHEIVKEHPHTTTVLFVGKKEAILPKGSVFKKQYDKIFSEPFNKKTLKLTCGAH